MVRFAVWFAVAMVFLTGLANAEPVKLRFAFFTVDTETSYVTTIKPFAKAVNEAAQGAIEIDLYPNGALGRSMSQQAQMLLDGVADIAFLVPGLTPGRFPDNGVMELPGLFRSIRESTLVYSRIATSGILRGYEDYLVIGAIGSEPFTIHSRVKIASLADLKDKKLRTTNATEAETLKELGAVPVLLPLNEVPEAVGRGTIDGATVDPAALYDFGVNRVTGYDYMLGLGFTPIAVLMNRKKFESLPQPGQEAIRKYAGEWFAQRYAEGYGAYERESLARLKADPKHQVIVPTDADVAAAQGVYKHVIDDWLTKNPRNPELLKAVRDETAKLRAEQ